MATKALLERNLIQGTCTLFGTPNEEGSAAGNGKIVLVNSGEIQKRTDFCLMLQVLFSLLLFISRASSANC